MLAQFICLTKCDSHTIHKLSQRCLTADWLDPRESDCSRMHSKVSSDWLPSYIKAMWHTYINTNKIHTCIHTYVHTYIQNTYMHTKIHAYIRTYVHTYIHTYIHACMHAYTHTHIYIHTHTHTHTNTRECTHFMGCKDYWTKSLVSTLRTADPRGIVGSLQAVPIIHICTKQKLEL
jgi:hypothetical protein